MPESALWGLVVSLVMLALGCTLKLANLSHRLNRAAKESEEWKSQFDKLSEDISSLPSTSIGIETDTEESNVFKKFFQVRFGSEKPKDISGVWVTQYKYPSTISEGERVEKIETQVVHFFQSENFVTGETLDALKHPEVFEGYITKSRYFTGLYLNKVNHHNYHGSFQFVISNSKNRMKGLWIGFSRNGNDIDSGEWRWEQIFPGKELTEEKYNLAIEKSREVDLFNKSFYL